MTSTEFGTPAATDAATGTTGTGTDAATPFVPAPATAYQGDIARYWNNEARPVNLRLGDVDGLYHHHYGIGEVDHAALGTPRTARTRRS